MQKPRISIMSIDFSERPQFSMPSTVTHIANITYQQDDVDYPLTVSGESDTQQGALKNALQVLKWNIALDSEFTEDESRLLKSAHYLYEKQGRSTRYMENVLAHLSGVEIRFHVESNPVRQLAREGLLLRHTDAEFTLFQLSEMGKYIVESHPNIKHSEKR
jgi:hypothetical protein